MKTIFEHRVDISDGSGIIKDSDGYTVCELLVDAESDKQIVVRNSLYGHFVVIELAEKYSHNVCLNKESISITTQDNVWGNRVSYTLYSTSKKSASSIKKAIEREIQKKLGLFIKGIDLSCIKEEAK